MEPRSSFFLLTLFMTLLMVGCEQPLPEESSDGSSSSRRLYVSSGLCYSGGGLTTFTNLTSSNMVYSVNLATGARESVIADYNRAPALTGDSPTSIHIGNGDELQILVENTTTVAARRIETASKSSTSRSLLISNAAALNGVVRDMIRLPSGDFLVSKSTAIERFTSGNVRILKGTNPYVSAPAAPCATSTTLHSKLLTLPSGAIIYAHAATGQNRIGIIAASGYGVAADCKAAQAAPNAAAFPTAMAYDAVNSKLIVAYGGASTADNLNVIYAYNVNETTLTISSPQEIYDSNRYPTDFSYLLFGISGLALDPETGHLYVATAITTATTVLNYAIEKLSYNASAIGVNNNSVLRREGSVPFYQYGSDTKCISDMVIAK